MILADISVLLILAKSKFGNIAIQLKCLCYVSTLTIGIIDLISRPICHSLELELLHGFVSCLVQRKNPTLVVCCLVFGVIMIIKTYFFTFYDFS